MLGPWFSYLTALKVISFFLLVFYYAPSRLVAFHQEDEGLDRFFISFIHMVSITIALVHLLAFTRLYDYLSLVGGYILVMALVTARQGRSPVRVMERLGMGFLVSLLDAAEGTGGMMAGARSYLRSRWQAFLATGASWLRWAASPAGGWLPLGVLVYAAYLRFNHSLTHAYLGASDSYLHLAWTKYLDSNQIYRDGIYPYGYHAVLSALERLTFVDPMLVLRFVGPLGGLLMVLSVYYVSRKLCRGVEVAAVLGTFVFGTGIGLPGDIWRQISPLPQEFAAIFLLPGLYFATRFAQERNRRDLILFAECLGITVAVHPYVSVYLVLGVALLVVVWLGSGRTAWRTALHLARWGLVAAVAGMLPLGIGMALGLKFHGSLGYVAKMVRLGPPTGGGNLPPGPRLLSGNVFTDAVAGLSLLLTLYYLGSLAWRRGKGAEAMSHLAFTSFSLVMYFMYRTGDWGLPVVMDPARTGIFFSLAASVILGVAAYRLLTVVKPELWPLPGRTYLASGLVLLALLSLAFGYPARRPPEGFRLEYDAAADNYLRIRGTFPALDWTIVSPAEQYAEVLNRGWHYESWEFVRDFTLEQAMDPSFDLPIPTTYVFIYAEKIPLFPGEPLDIQLAQEKLPPPGDDPTEQYYYNGQNRSIIMAKVIQWSQAYRRSHSNMSIFYEDREMVIYLIKHQPKLKSQ